MKYICFDQGDDPMFDFESDLSIGIGEKLTLSDDPSQERQFEVIGREIRLSESTGTITGVWLTLGAMRPETLEFNGL